ncbi:MAG: cation transporter, partial [Muribaculaceae bacterium]|nr:cation transporter [Muribaculaceae bacterium]
AIYVGSVVATAIAFGLVIDMLLPASWFVPPVASAAGIATCHLELSWFDTSCSTLLAALLVYTAVKGHRHSHKHNIDTAMTQTFKIEGMACAHCKATVEKAVAAVDGVTSVTVSLQDGTAVAEGNADREAVTKAIELAGFTVVG